MLQALREQFRAAMKVASDLRAKYGGDLTKFDAEDEKAYSAAIEEASSLRERIELAEREEGLATWGKAPSGTPPVPADPASGLPSYQRVGRVTAFQGTTEERERKAFGFGQWLAATILRNQAAEQWCQRNGIQTRVLTENINTAGGYTVPAQFSNDIIDLRDTFGLARQALRIRQMTSDVLDIPRKSGRVTATWGAEAGTMTAQDSTFDMVKLTTEKLYCYSSFSNELSADSAINIGNDVAQDFARAFAQAEDAACFMGDGTATYGGALGIAGEFAVKGATMANRSGCQVVAAAGGLWSAIVIGDILAMMALLPSYANNPRTAFYCSQTFFMAVFARLASAAGGVTMTEILGGLGREPRFLGYPVRLSPFMPAGLGTVCVGTGTTTAQVLATGLAFGDLSMAGSLGDRGGVSIAQSEHILFASDSIAIRGVERVDINIHDTGNYSATAALRVPGPVVVLSNAAA